MQELFGPDDEDMLMDNVYREDKECRMCVFPKITMYQWRMVLET